MIYYGYRGIDGDTENSSRRLLRERKHQKFKKKKDKEKQKTKKKETTKQKSIPRILFKIALI